MVEENIRQEFRLKNIDKTRNYLIEEINRNELMRKKHKTVCTTLNYIEHFLILAASRIGYVPMLPFLFCFFSWYSYRNYEFCNKIKNLCNNSRKKGTSQ